jgi:ABC-2 type transport system permease protein
MRLYFEIGLRAFRRATTYRSAYIAGILTNAFFGALMCFIYKALYTSGNSVAGMSLHDATTYVWLTQSIISVGGGWIGTEIIQTIRTGEIANDMARPWSFFGYWLSRSFGERLLNLLFRGSLTYLIGVLYFRAAIPSFEQFAPFVIAILLSMVLSFALGFIVNMVAFWTIDAVSMIWLVNTIVMFFSGFLLPLAFFPEPLAAIARLLPFQAITSLPVLIFLGKIEDIAILNSFLLQIFWIVLLVAIALRVQRAAMRKLIIQGG